MINNSSGLFHELVECSPDAQLVVNTQGSILYANAYAHSLFGYEPDSLRGVQIEELVPHEHRAAHFSHRQRYAVSPHAREMGTREMRLAALRRDGTLFPAEIRLAPVRSEHGLLTAAAVRDATANERIKSSLDSARREAEEANNAKSRFLAAASHDLRQPMQALRLIHGALVKRAEGPGVSELLGEQGHALDTMSQLLHALLNVAKLESGTVRADIAETDLRTIFDDLRLQFAPIAAAKGIALDIDASGGHVLSDRTLLHELLQNLLANAVRYTDVGRVGLRCVPGPGRVRIEVEDTGIGIPADLQERIFQDFYQVASHGSEHRGGAGLGLGIVRRVAQLLGARVCVVSREEVGTKFSVEVPACEPAADAETSRSPAACNVTHLRILIVEDEVPLRTAL
jgi:PAS domain S-box-containing protein